MLEGYGLTESCAATAFNPWDRQKIGTVGQPLPGSVVRIADDGEVLLHGEHLFKEYWNNPGATAEALADGWFHTGDIGTLDEDGYLRITGRKKEIIVTAGGKNVAPAVIEDRIRAHALVAECMVVGDGRPFVGALVTIDEEFLGRWCAEHGKPAGATAAALREDPDLLAAVQAAVDDGNAAVSKAESVRKFRILPAQFTEESGHLTPSLKLKRNVVAKDYADEIEALYASSRRPSGRVVLQQRLQVLRQQVPAPLLLHPPAAPLAHPAAQFGVLEEGHDAVGGLRGCAAADHPAGLPVQDRVRGAAGVARDDRQAGGGGLQVDDAETPPRPDRRGGCGRAWRRRRRHRSGRAARTRARRR